MSVDEKLTQHFQEIKEQIKPPPYLKQKVLAKIAENDGSSKMKKRIIAICLAISFIIPTSALSYTAYLANELYGSFENVLNHFGSATADSYLLLQTKLLQAKGELSQDDFETFMEQLKVISSMKIEYGDEYGNIAFDLIPEKKVEEFKQALALAQPYFDRLNGNEPLIDHLTPAEYEKYIEALIDYETILVHSGINPSKTFTEDDVKQQLRDTFIETRNTIEQFEQRGWQTDSLFPMPTVFIDGNEAVVEYGIVEASENELIDYRGFAHVLSPISLSKSESFNVVFNDDFEKISYTIVDDSSSHSLENLEVPQQAGKYVIAVEAYNNQKVMAFVFLLNVTE